MLTEAQQKVKHELEELKANAQMQYYGKKSFVHKTSSFKKPVIALIGISLLFLTFVMVLFSISTPHHNKLKDYITEEQEYNQLSNKLTAAGYAETAHYDKNYVQQVSSKYSQILIEVRKMPVPAELKAHKQDFIKVMEQRAAILALVADAKTRDTVQVNRLLLELDIKQELAKESLLKAFDREKIKYLENEDGSVQYWINRESYQFSW
jgi:hypothetical protein